MSTGTGEGGGSGRGDDDDDDEGEGNEEWKLHNKRRKEKMTSHRSRRERLLKGFLRTCLPSIPDPPFPQNFHSEYRNPDR